MNHSEIYTKDVYQKALKQALAIMQTEGFEITNEDAKKCWEQLVLTLPNTKKSVKIYQLRRGMNKSERTNQF